MSCNYQRSVKSAKLSKQVGKSITRCESTPALKFLSSKNGSRQVIPGTCKDVTHSDNASGFCSLASTTYFMDGKLMKAMHAFYIWYPELCRRQNLDPVLLRKLGRKTDKILSINATRPSLRDWSAIINALRLDQTLHTIKIASDVPSLTFNNQLDSEEKIKNAIEFFRPIGTKYILNNLLMSVQNCLKMSSVLTSLELEGIHITPDYLDIVLKGLAINESVKYLSFKSCPIGDIGCLNICKTILSLPNIEALNLSSCGLSSKSGYNLAQLIHKQRLERCTECWCNSLRYKEIDPDSIEGLVRITLNNNPKIGDEGLEYILNELLDDLWIKAIDMQNCNITEKMTEKILEVVEFNTALRIFDIQNNNLPLTALKRILLLLHEKDPEKLFETEFKWYGSISRSNSATSFSTRSEPQLDRVSCGFTTLSSMRETQSQAVKQIKSTPCRRSTFKFRCQKKEILSSSPLNSNRNYHRCESKISIDKRSKKSNDNSSRYSSMSSIPVDIIYNNQVNTYENSSEIESSRDVAVCMYMHSRNSSKSKKTIEKPKKSRCGFRLKQTKESTCIPRDISKRKNLLKIIYVPTNLSSSDDEIKTKPKSSTNLKNINNKSKVSSEIEPKSVSLNKDPEVKKSDNIVDNDEFITLFKPSNETISSKSLSSIERKSDHKIKTSKMVERKSHVNKRNYKKKDCNKTDKKIHSIKSN